MPLYDYTLRFRGVQLICGAAFKSMRQDRQTKQSLKPGQIYEGQSKPVYGGLPFPTRRLIIEIDFEKKKITWEPIRIPLKFDFDHKRRTCTIASFLQWANKLVYDVITKGDLLTALDAAHDALERVAEVADALGHEALAREAKTAADSFGARVTALSNIARLKT